MNDIMKKMLGHISVRSYSSQLIEKDLLNEIIRCGQAASSSSFIQAYSVVRVSHQSKRKIIAQAAGNQVWVEKAAEFLVLCADLKRIEYCCNSNNMGQLEGYTEHFIAATVDSALMAQNMMLAAESAGLGGVFIGGIRNDPKAVADCLNLPVHVYPAFGMCLGWPKKKADPKPRFPVEVILHQDQYRDESLSQLVETYDHQMTDYYATRGMNARQSNWSQQTAQAIQGKKREHMLHFLQQRGFLKK